MVTWFPRMGRPKGIRQISLILRLALLSYLTPPFIPTPMLGVSYLSIWIDSKSFVELGCGVDDGLRWCPDEVGVELSFQRRWWLADVTSFLVVCSTDSWFHSSFGSGFFLFVLAFAFATLILLGCTSWTVTVWIWESPLLQYWWWSLKFW